MATEAEKLRNFYQGMGSSRFTPVNLPPEEEVTAMPAEEDLAAADEAYEQAREDLGLKPEVTGESSGSLNQEEINKLIKSYTSDILNRMSQEEKTAERLSAYNILKMEFDQYGLGSLVTDIRDLLVNDTPTSEFGLRLRGTDAYKTRFKANETRIAAGLSALSPAEYVALEDQYQNVMRNYGIPASYYAKDTTGRQSGFEKFIAGDVSATELEERISTAQQRVLNASPEVQATLRTFFPDVQNGDILAYVLDPTQGLENIKRKVTAAEIGGAATSQGLQTSLERAMQLAGYGVTGQKYQQAASTIAEATARGGQLAAMYKQDPYTQQTAEEAILNVGDSAEALKRTKKVEDLEKASFSKKTGGSSIALGRERAMGQGAF